jgi:hypothetical protein
MSLLPTDNVMAPPSPLVDEPDAINIVPLPVLLLPVDRSRSPVEEAKLSSDVIVTPPVFALTEEPLVIRTLPPWAAFPRPAVSSILLPAPTPLAPTDNVIAPPTAPEDEPLAIEIAPANALLTPVDIETAPDDEPDVDEVAPVAIATFPLAKLVEEPAAVCIVIPPDTPDVAEPLVICTAPPFRFVDAPAVREIALPAPTVLVPTDMLMAPPMDAPDDPLVMEIAPAAPLLAPDASDSDPEVELPVLVVVAPVAMVTEPVFLLPATPSDDFMEIEPVLSNAADPLVTNTSPPANAPAVGPAVKEMSLPAPLVLTPTDMLMAPPTAAADDPLVMEIEPAAPLLAPDAMTTLPDAATDPLVAVVAPVPIVMPPDPKLFAPLAAVCTVIAPLAPASAEPLEITTPPPV